MNPFKNIKYTSDKDTINLNWDDLSVRYHYNFLENAIISNLSSAKRVLDIGPGYGHWIEFYQKVYDVYVEFIDISKNNVDDLMNKFHVLGFTGSIVDTKLVRKFDVINAIGVLHHIMKDKDLIKVISNIEAMLSPGGTILIGTRFDHSTNEKNRKYRTLDWWKQHLGDIKIVRSDPPAHCKKHLDLIIKS